MLENEFTDSDRIKFREQTIKRNKNTRLNKKRLSEKHHVTMNMVAEKDGNMLKVICYFIVVEGKRTVEVIIIGYYRTDLVKNKFQLRNINFYPIWKN
ncbi:hypothetical protein [Methanohalobium sp.]|uniref:hypothetical protein n=1 Tax=Methanohalobium sp. TaxID=2837493 RepID=UPI0025EEEAEB|nr:hypothetical protein [Methanohalobium sp.]